VSYPDPKRAQTADPGVGLLSGASILGAGGPAPNILLKGPRPTIALLTILNPSDVDYKKFLKAKN